MKQKKSACGQGLTIVTQKKSVAGQGLTLETQKRKPEQVQSHVRNDAARTSLAQQDDFAAALAIANGASTSSSKKKNVSHNVQKLQFQSKCKLTETNWTEVESSVAEKVKLLNEQIEKLPEDQAETGEKIKADVKAKFTKLRKTFSDSRNDLKVILDEVGETASEQELPLFIQRAFECNKRFRGGDMREFNVLLNSSSRAVKVG